MKSYGWMALLALAGSLSLSAVELTCLQEGSLAETKTNLFKPSSDAAEGRFVAVLFIRSDCPISNKYAPELSRIQKDFASRGISFFLVHCDRDESVAEIRTHAREYALDFPILLDPTHKLVKKAGAKATPEAALFDAKGVLLYHGRIDDRFPQLGTERIKPTEATFRNALEAALSARPMPRSIPAIGCSIRDLR
jgi:thiol-disulfide isomerase/thioredoxin